ncbi:MAG: VOC family protein [Gammaproteobacteria bacterium]|nr:VOC family protein [Gammaproteobacteria bacterium]
MKLDRLDHLVLTVTDINATVDFYVDVLGMAFETFGDNRVALKFGNQKINLHQSGNEFEPKAERVQPGSADLCFVATTELNEVVSHLEARGVEIIDGPVKRTGATGSITSIYLNDLDGNLLEISNYCFE